MNIPSQAEIIIIGGGIIGCSLAYHLTKTQKKDVVLLERKKLTSGTTWHAAGLIGQLKATQNMTKLAIYTSNLLQELEKETGQTTGFKQNGALFLATNQERLEEYRRNLSMAKRFNLEVNEVSTKEILDLYPMLNIDDVIGGIFSPNEGHVNPTDTTQAYAKGARMGGAQIFENIKVNDIITQQNRIKSVITDEGEIQTEYVVNCAGMWGHEVSKMCGAITPLHPAEHFYIVTEAIEGLHSQLPSLRDPDNQTYYKEEGVKMLVGFFEPNAKPWGMNGIPNDFEFGTLAEDWEHLTPYLEKVAKRFPAFETAGIQLFFNGPESFTPDDRYLLGESSNIKNFFIAAGFNSIGIQSSGGVGKILAEWIANGYPPMDIWDIDIRRMMPFQNNKRYLKERTTEMLGELYSIHYPWKQPQTSRNIRHSVLHDRFKQAGACFGEANGWERANWFASEGEKAEYQFSYFKQNWFKNSAKEHLAVRNTVGLFDMSSLSKFILKGKDAVHVLNRIAGNQIDVPIGRIVYTQLLNHRGGIEADVTITRVDHNEFLIVSGVATQIRDFYYIESQIKENEMAVLFDITSNYVILSVMGPNSRALLQNLTTDNLSHQTFPFGHSQIIDLCYARIRASRISYVGELGWELYIPTEFCQHIFDEIMEIGKQHGLQLAGMHALNSLRIEKGYRHFGHDITDEDTPIEAGLGFTLKFNKNVEFLGQEFLLKQKTEGVHKKLAIFTHDQDQWLLHNEPIYRNNKIIGHISSGMFGHSIGKMIGLGYIEDKNTIVDNQYLTDGEYAIEISCQKIPAQIHLKPVFDPQNIKMKS